jgi:hypothetical protein
MEADGRLDTAHTRQSQEEFSAGAAELSGHDEQQLQDVQHLRSAESAVTAGKKQETLDHEAYKEAVQKYGSGDPRSAAAKQSLKQSREAMDPLLESRRTLKENVHDGRRRVHDDKTVLGIQKRSMDSDARYRAEDDRTIEKKEQNIADDRRAMTPTLSASEPPVSK